MSKGMKIGLVVVTILAAAGIAYLAFGGSSKKSGVKSKDDRRITFTKNK
jgi:hypothetical protein